MSCSFGLLIPEWVRENMTTSAKRLWRVLSTPDYVTNRSDLRLVVPSLGK